MVSTNVPLIYGRRGYYFQLTVFASLACVSYNTSGQFFFPFRCDQSEYGSLSAYSSLQTCPIYMNGVGSSIAVDDPTHRICRVVKFKKEVSFTAGSRTAWEAANISTDRDDPSVENLTRLLEVSGREKKIKTSMNTGGCCAKKNVVCFVLKD